MAVKIRKMTESEFDRFYQWSTKQHTTELMEEFHMSREKATREAIAEISQMLPNGFDTEHNQFMTIVAEDEIAGFIWTLHEETEGRKQCFICDFAIWEPHRRKGYGEAALHLAEEAAAEAGCRECVLFVSDANVAASALYEKCGYRILRPANHGTYRIKSTFSPASRGGEVPPLPHINNH